MKRLELRNPLSEDHVALRTSLISGLLEVLERNIRAGAESVSIFELAVYSCRHLEGGTASRNFALGKCRARRHWRLTEKTQRSTYLI